MENRFLNFLLKISLLAIVVLSVVQVKLKLEPPYIDNDNEKEDSISVSDRPYEFTDSIFVGDSVSAKEMIPDSLFEKDQIQRWKSEKPEIASVDSISGVIVSHESGSCDILGFIKQDTIFKVHVNVSPSIEKESDIKVTSIKMKEKQLTLNCSDEMSIPFDLSPTEASNKKLNWESSDPRIATVDSNGKIKALKEGTTTITATSTDGSAKQASTIITVKQPAPNPIEKPTITWVKTESSMNEGSSYQLKIKSTPQNVSLKWTSTDPSVVSVDSNGKVTAKKSGTAKIFVTAITSTGHSAEKSISINVKERIKPIDNTRKAVSNYNLGIGSYYGYLTNNKPDGGYIKMNDCTLTLRSGKKIIFKSGDRVDVTSYSQDPSSGRIIIMGDITRTSGDIEKNVMFFYYKD